MIAQAAMIGIGIISVAVLGRLLTPEDFGIVAISASFVAFVTMFADHGLPQAIVQRENITNEQVSSLFWINCVSGIAAAIIGSVIAWPVSLAFDRPELFGVIAALSSSLIITGLGAPQLALLRRQLRFRTHAVIGVTANAIGVIAATAAALIGWGYWALVVMTITMTTVRTIGGWLFAGWRPLRPAIAEGIGPMVRIGAYLTGTALVSTIARAMDRLLIGYGIGTAAAGFYANASRLILMPTGQLEPLTSVAIPVLSRLQNQHDRFRAFYRRGIEVIIFALCPFVLVAMVAADHIVPFCLGDQWNESIPIFRALTPAALVACSRVITSWVYIPLGQTDRQFRWRIFGSITTVASYVIGLNWGAVGLATAFSIQTIVVRIPGIIYCLHGTFVTVSDVLSATWRIGVAVAFSVAAGFTMLPLLPDSSHFVAIVLITLIVFTTYIVAFAITPGGWHRLRSMRDVMRHLRGGPDQAPPAGETS